MAGLKPYVPNKPTISIDKGDWLDRMVEAGIPLTRALKYFRDNPEGKALKTVKLTAEDVEPTGFYSTYMNDGDALDYVTEAALMFSPVKGHRMKVRTMSDGTPNLKDLGIWYENKISQLRRIEEEIIKRDPSIVVDQLDREILRKEHDYKFDEELLNSPDRRRYYGIPENPYSIEKLKENLRKTSKELMDLCAKRDQKALDILDYNGMTHKDYVDKFGTMLEDSDDMPFIDRHIRNEYGKGMTVDDINILLQHAWNEGAGLSQNQLKVMYKDIINGK